MSGVEKSALTTALTIFGGIVVYVTGQLLYKFLIEPAYELRKAIAEVGFVLSFYGRIICTPIARNEARSEKAYDAILKSASDLIIKVDAVPFYSTVSKVSGGSLPPRSSVIEAARSLRTLTTYVKEAGTEAVGSLPEILALIKRIEKHLRLPSLE